MRVVQQNRNEFYIKILADMKNKNVDESRINEQEKNNTCVHLKLMWIQQVRQIREMYQAFDSPHLSIYTSLKYSSLQIHLPVLSLLEV